MLGYLPFVYRVNRCGSRLEVLLPRIAPGEFLYFTVITVISPYIWGLRMTIIGGTVADYRRETGIGKEFSARRDDDDAHDGDLQT